jgi:hypothetical protein
LFHYGDSNSEPPAVQPVASWYTDCGIPAQQEAVGKIISEKREIQKMRK